jgi:hypothetical protein
MTVQCPSTFRIFAAQPPMARGGGRKGLPQSFLNRFTKVHLAPLLEKDLRAIVASNYTVVTAELIDKMMINFNQQRYINFLDTTYLIGSLIGTSDRVVFCNESHARRAAPSIWRNIRYPMVSCSASEWAAIGRLRKLARRCCIEPDELTS